MGLGAPKGAKPNSKVAGTQACLWTIIWTIQKIPKGAKPNYMAATCFQLPSNQLVPGVEVLPLWLPGGLDSFLPCVPKLEVVEKREEGKVFDSLESSLKLFWVSMITKGICGASWVYNLALLISAEVNEVRVV